jgi:hypothetical protein
MVSMWASLICPHNLQASHEFSELLGSFFFSALKYAIEPPILDRLLHIFRVKTFTALFVIIITVSIVFVISPVCFIAGVTFPKSQNKANEPVYSDWNPS